MDNLVDIDALLGDLELESDDVNPKVSSINKPIHGSIDSASQLSVNGASLLVANGSESVLEHANNGHIASNATAPNFMDDLIDISDEPNFGPALGTLQKSFTGTSTVNTLLQPMVFDSCNPSTGNHNVPAVSTVNSATTRQPAEPESGSQLQIGDFFDFSSPPEPKVSATVASTASFPSGNGLSFVQLEASSLKADGTTAMLRPAASGKKEHEASSRFLQDGPLSQQNVPSAQNLFGLPPQAEVLPLTEDVHFLEQYESKRSDSLPMLDSQAMQPQTTSQARETSTHNPSTALGSLPSPQAPSLSQFSSDFNTSLNSNICDYGAVGAVPSHPPSGVFISSDNSANHSSGNFENAFATTSLLKNQDENESLANGRNALLLPHTSNHENVTEQTIHTIPKQSFAHVEKDETDLHHSLNNESTHPNITKPQPHIVLAEQFNSMGSSGTTDSTHQHVLSTGTLAVEHSQSSTENLQPELSLLPETNHPTPHTAGTNVPQAASGANQVSSSNSDNSLLRSKPEIPVRVDSRDPYSLDPKLMKAIHSEVPAPQMVAADTRAVPSDQSAHGVLEPKLEGKAYSAGNTTESSELTGFGIDEQLPQCSFHAESNFDDEFNSLLAANGYSDGEQRVETEPDMHPDTGLGAAAQPFPVPLLATTRQNLSGSVDSFTRLQYGDTSQPVDSFTALHNMSVSQAHRNSLLEQNGILPASEADEDIGWDIGATTPSVAAEDVFADIGLDEMVTVDPPMHSNGADLDHIDELPPGEVPPAVVDPNDPPGFMEDRSPYFHEQANDGIAAQDGLVADTYTSEANPTTADLQAMVMQEEPVPQDTQDDYVSAGDVTPSIPDTPPPPYQATDPALNPQPQLASTMEVPHFPDVAQQPPAETEGGDLDYIDLGATKPYWMPDSETTVCLACQTKFTFTKRRHHCRSCGKIFCVNCCNMKSRLQYLDFKEARVCNTCHQNIALAAEQQARLFNSQAPSQQVESAPPASAPPAEDGAVGGAEAIGAEAPAAPTGVLKDTSNNRLSGGSRDANRSVIFSDGIRPGDENSHLDGSDATPSSRVRRRSKNRQKTDQRLRETLRNTFLIPDSMLPPLLCYDNDSAQYSAVDSEPDELGLIAKLREEGDDGRFAFAIHKDLCVEVKIVNMDCCTNKQCWCFTSHGLNTVSQDEVVLVLECLPDEDSIPRDVFHLYKMLYQQAAAGQQVTELGYADLSIVPPFNTEKGFLGSLDHIGLLFIRATFQCVKGLCLPDPPYLFAILIHRLELPWARLFPVRLKLRLGAEFKYYPCPLMSVRGREPVYRQISNTIMNLLADFRTYKYTLTKIEGFTVHLMDKVTTISIPKNMYPAVMKVVGASQECVIAFGASFSTLADSHIVCMQNEDSTYASRTMNIRDQQRTVTGASFVVFSGSMKESYGAPAKCSIVEDGIMVQITKEALDDFKVKLNNMQEYTVVCSRADESREQNEEVKIVWVDDYKDYNIGVVSPIDELPMDGVMSLRVKSFNDLTRDSYTIRWTEVFFVQVDESRLSMDAMEITQFSETVANSTCSALAPYLVKLHEQGMKKVALRVTLGPEQVEYVCGSLGRKLNADVMNCLDGELVPVLHSAASVISGSLLVLELIFHVLE